MKAFEQENVGRLWKMLNNKVRFWLSEEVQG